MYEVRSQQLITAIGGSGRTFRALMDFGDFSVGSESIKTIKTIGGSCGGEDVTIGGAYSQGITAELSQTPCDLEGRAFQLYICLIDLSDDTQENGEESELIPMGRFFAASCKKKDGGYILEASDHLALADTEYRSKLPYPASTKAIEEEICTQLGISSVAVSSGRYITSDNKAYKTSDGMYYQLYDYVAFINKKPSGITMRQMISYIASLQGRFAVLDRTGRLTYRWYGSDGAVKLDPDTTDTPQVSETDVAITQIQCTVSENSVITGGKPGRTMYIENPYMTKELLDRLCAEILPFIYRPVSLYQRIGDPRIDVWDTAEFYLPDSGESFSAPVMELSFEFDGGLSASIEAAGQSDTETEMGAGGSSSSGGGSAGAEKALYIDVRDAFPEPGIAGRLYIASDENAVYYWDVQQKTYKCAGRDYTEAAEIQCIL